LSKASPMKPLLPVMITVSRRSAMQT
jgi:hypothetical protein